MTGSAPRALDVEPEGVEDDIEDRVGVRGEGYLTRSVHVKPRRISELPVLKWLQKWSQQWSHNGSSFWGGSGTAPGLPKSVNF